MIQLQEKLTVIFISYTDIEDPRSTGNFFILSNFADSSTSPEAVGTDYDNGFCHDSHQFGGNIPLLSALRGLEKNLRPPPIAL